MENEGNTRGRYAADGYSNLQVPRRTARTRPNTRTSDYVGDRTSAMFPRTDPHSVHVSPSLTRGSNYEDASATSKPNTNTKDGWSISGLVKILSGGLVGSSSTDTPEENPSVHTMSERRERVGDKFGTQVSARDAHMVEHDPIYPVLPGSPDYGEQDYEGPLPLGTIENPYIDSLEMGEALRARSRMSSRPQTTSSLHEVGMRYGDVRHDRDRMVHMSDHRMPVQNSGPKYYGLPTSTRGRMYHAETPQTNMYGNQRPTGTRHLAGDIHARTFHEPHFVPSEQYRPKMRPHAHPSVSSESGPDEDKLNDLPKDDPLFEYIPHTTQEDAEEWLLDDPHGTYLLRRQNLGSTAVYSKQDLILSIKQTRPAQMIVHKRIHVYSTHDGRSPKLYTLRDEFIPEETFASIKDLIEFYEVYPYEPPNQILGSPLAPGGALAPVGADTHVTQDSNHPVSSVLWYQSKVFQAIILILMYFFIGIMYFTQREMWEFREALYFCIVIVTTVGYGDHGAFNHSDSDDVTFVFTGFFVLFGVGIIFAAISILLAAVAEKQKERQNKLMKEAVQGLLGADTEKSKSEPDGAVLVKAGPSPHWVKLMAVVSYCRNNDLVNYTIQLVLIQSIGIMYAMLEENVDADSGKHFSFVEAWYWTVVTGTTVGFGDFSAESAESQWFAIFYLLPLVVVTGNFLQALAALLAGGPNLEKLLKRGLDEDLIKEFDISGDGEVDKGEWLRAFLVAMGKADPDLCDIILEQFDILDATGDGSLSTADILVATNLSTKQDASSVRKRQQERSDKLMSKASGWKARSKPRDARMGILGAVPNPHPNETFAI